jgi:addiction module HigA family antidote
MIISFKDKEVEKIWNGIASNKLPFEIQHIARRKLRMINNSQNINDLRIPPGNRLEKLNNVTPGEILQEEFLIPLGISQYRLAKELNIPQTRISGIINSSRRITADTALRLSLFFGNSAKFWLGLQDDFDIENIKSFQPSIYQKIKRTNYVTRMERKFA